MRFHSSWTLIGVALLRHVGQRDVYIAHDQIEKTSGQHFAIEIRMFASDSVLLPRPAVMGIQVACS